MILRWTVDHILLAVWIEHRGRTLRYSSLDVCDVSRFHRPQGARPRHPDDGASTTSPGIPVALDLIRAAAQSADADGYQYISSLECTSGVVW